MCGIICLFNAPLIRSQKTLQHRGPDETCAKVLGLCTMIFSRLAINDLSSDGMQPFISTQGMLVCNGEIFNHKEFGNSSSDCACLMPLIHKYGIHTASRQIRGEFAMCYTDGKIVYASRDPFGVRPLFYARIGSGIVFASEIKVLLDYNVPVQIFPPGHSYNSVTNQMLCWYPYMWKEVFSDKSLILGMIRDSFENAVKIRIENTERNIGFLLSGGLDSSLVVAVAKKFLPNTRLKTFSVGTSENSPDIKAAKIVAQFLDTDHTELIFTPDEGLSQISNVIYSLESYDTTTVRASVPMWLLAQYISQKTDCKVILSGEGSDELYGGYLYFHGAPDTQAFTDECTRRLKLIHQFDGLRADRCIAAHGLELRVPFLDVDFVDLGMSINQALKQSPLEKQILRDAFIGYLPDEILYRQKNGMSDAVGYNWVDSIKEYANTNFPDYMEIQKQTFHCAPQTCEESLYRKIFWQHFGHLQDHLISEIWRPKWTSITDPSARHLEVFKFTN